MKICYVWSKKFRHLNDFGISLDSNFDYHFSSESNELSQTKKTSLPKNFFGDDINEMSCVIGVSGKTTALELVCAATTDSDFLYDFIIVFEDDDKLYYVSDREINVNFGIEKANKSELNKLDVVFYSSKYETYDLELPETVKDLSFTNLINNDGFDDLLEKQTLFIYSNVSHIDTAGKNKPTFENGYWQNIDSLELLYVDLLSMIWDSYKTNEEVGQKETLICLDNFDARMHPVGQIEAVSKLIELLPKVTGNKVQVVLSTNSPMVLSDFPSQCVTNLDNKEHDFKTFGANLYEMYDESFNVDSRTGSFSQNYIKNILEMLGKDNDSLTDSEKKEILYSLKIISDQVIHFHIKKRADEF